MIARFETLPMRLVNYISLLLGLVYFTSGVNAASKPLFSEASVDAQSASAHEVINVHMMGHTHDGKCFVSSLFSFLSPIAIFNRYSIWVHFH